MSTELGYFPPKGTKWEWGNKQLNYSPWICNLSDQYEKKLKLKYASFWPLSIKLYVDLIDGKFTWLIDIIDFNRKKYQIKTSPEGRASELKGNSENALEACLAAERIGEKELDKLIPDWAITALANNWRPPGV